MCRLFGLSAGGEPVSATFWLLQAPDSLRVQSHREPDGTGLGYFDREGYPHLDKQPLAAYHDPAFAREARTLESNMFIAHLRFASTGAIELRNTHPFEQRGRLLAHNGVIEDLPALERRIGGGMGLVHGETDSERLFALITSEIEERHGDVLAGITAAIEWVAANLPVLSLNFVLVSASELWALRYPETHELHLLERTAGAGTGSSIDHLSTHGTRVHCKHGRTLPSVVVASEVMDRDPAWRLLRAGELIHVNEQLEVRSHFVLDSTPARPLRLEDLDARARASQTGHTRPGGRTSVDG